MKCIAWVSLFAIWASGCILPIPHKRTHAPAISGVVVSKRSMKPIPNIIVKDDRFGVQTETDESGLFSLPSVRQWHGAYFISPISLSLFPAFDMAPRNRLVRICHGIGREMDAVIEGGKSSPACILVPDLDDETNQ